MIWMIVLNSVPTKDIKNIPKSLGAALVVVFVLVLVQNDSNSCIYKFFTSNEELIIVKQNIY